MFKTFDRILILILTVFLGYLIYNVVQIKNNRTETLLTKGQEVTFHLKTEVESVLSAVVSKGEALAKKLEHTKFTKNELETLIIKESNQLESLLGITVAYEPFVFDEEIALYAPYFDKNQNKIVQLEDLYNYTDASKETTIWYTQLKTIKNTWTEPYYGQGAQALVSDYSIALHDDNNRFIGVVSLTISLSQFSDYIHSLSLGKTGYGFVTSKAHNVLSHPITEYIGVVNLKELQEFETEKGLRNAYAAILKENPQPYYRYKSEEKNQQTLLVIDKVKYADWTIGVLFYEDDMLGKTNGLKQKYILIAVIGSLLFLAVLALFYKRDYLSQREIWYLSITATVLLLFNLCFVGYLEYNSKQINIEKSSPPVTSKTTLNSIENDERFKAKNRGVKLKTIPTGIYIEQVNFENSYNVNIGGTVWQKYPKDLINKVSVGFKLPQVSPFAEALFIEEQFRETKDDYILINYTFRATVKLSFDYSSYPFDKRDINLEIQPLRSSDGLLFVPDLLSYQYLSPSKKSGLSPHIKFSGSEIIETYFNYSYVNYTTNYGESQQIVSQTLPELQFNIQLRRVLITSFITYLIPIFVTLILIFIMIFSTTKTNNKFADTNVVQGMAAFFFVLIFSHIDLRKNIETADLIYMESFYFVTYFMIIISTFNLINYPKQGNSLFDYKDNLIVKTTYWPVFLSLVFIITLLTFWG